MAELPNEFETLETLELLSDTLKSKSMNELAEIHKEIDNKKNYASKALLEESGLPKPKKHMICENCQSAMWFGSKNYLRCYCEKMHTITYDSTNMLDEISVCDGNEIA